MGRFDLCARQGGEWVSDVTWKRKLYELVEYCISLWDKCQSYQCLLGICAVCGILK